MDFKEMSKATKFHILTGSAIFAFGLIFRAIFSMFFPLFMLIVGGVWLLYGIISFFAEKQMRVAVWLRVIYRIGLVCALISFIVVEGFIISGYRTDATGDEKYIIGLGGGMIEDVPSRAMQARIDALAEYMLEHPDTVTIVTGAQGRRATITEAEAYRRALIKAGIDEARIIKEERAVNTSQNMEFSAELIKAREGSLEGVSCAVVTNEFHLWRSKKLAERFGLEASGISARTPNVAVFIEASLREYFSVGKMLVGLGNSDFRFLIK